MKVDVEKLIPLSHNDKKDKPPDLLFGTKFYLPDFNSKLRSEEAQREDKIDNEELLEEHKHDVEEEQKDILRKSTREKKEIIPTIPKIKEEKKSVEYKHYYKVGDELLVVEYEDIVDEDNDSKNPKKIYEGVVSKITPTIIKLTFGDDKKEYEYKYNQIKTLYRTMDELKKDFPKAKKGKVFY
jgi:hypothetical protein